MVLRHELEVTWSDGKKERREVTMAVRGDPSSHTAMARTVGLPTAIAAKMVLDGKFIKTDFGVLRDKLGVMLLKPSLRLYLRSLW